MIEKKVFIYGLCNVYYDSYYIYGIKEIFSKIEFNILKFPNFNQGTFAFIIVEGEQEKKIIIDSKDSNQIDTEALNWCDRYGKINYHEETIASFDASNKIVAIGPSFGIKIWNIFDTTWFGISNFLKFKTKITNKREFIANYWRQYRRVLLENYSPNKSMDNEVFFISSIWSKEHSTNNFRASFISECKKNENLKFVGGFAPRNDGNNLEFDSLVFPKKIALPSYISKIKKSSIVFNTPAVLSCHGWKLAEFLALGKAIVSTSHKNSMPETLKDNIHIVYVESQEDIERMINKMITNLNFKKELEINSRDYFERNLAPKVIINKLLNKNL
jgi:glycosyltransferase involved in cell wall biosynthesis